MDDVEAKQVLVPNFYLNAIKCMDEVDPQGSATIHYSLANFHHNQRKLLSAISHYNWARSLEPGYVEKDYFLNEVGGTLFFAGRYRLSSLVYERCNRLKPLARTAICAGDGPLYAGKFHLAENFYGQVLEIGSENDFELNEALLKAWLATNAPKSNAGHMVRGRRSDHADLEKHLAKAAETNDAYEGIVSALLIAFKDEGFVECWSNAISIALNFGEVELTLLVMSAATWRHGYEAYAPVREKLSSAAVPSDIISEIDELVHSLYARRKELASKGVTVRLAGQSYFDTTKLAQSNHPV
ncbi:hypothetical protein [Pelagibacterium luteolum]|nr:hypothetical protein [Pelagibacterium luteolum]